MNRTLTTWLVFAASLLLVLSVLIFFTLKVLDYEISAARQEQSAVLEENVRLALWRMDSAAATTLAERRAARPLSWAANAPDSQPQAANPPAEKSVQPQPQAQGKPQSYRFTEWRDNSNPNSQSILIQSEYASRATLNTSAEPVTDWESFAPDLLGRIKDIFPDARLVAYTQPALPGKANPRALATIPARLVIHEDSMPVIPLPWNTPVRISLLVAWASAVAAALAVGLLLKGVIDLSERRAAFVSTVTHELRTPLTTFRMYSEMLADGMVESPEAQKQYHTTLVAEADRLGHLIENVLAYARLERQLSPKEARVLSVADLLERSIPSLERRARQGGHQLLIDIPQACQSLACRIDPIAVHQILLNLVDNACKYARTDIILTARQRELFLEISVSDTGPGIDSLQAARLFTAFSKSRDDAVPGIGLGLYLSRRLARQLGGDLTLEARDSKNLQGATFNFSIPLHRPKSDTPDT